MPVSRFALAVVLMVVGCRPAVSSDPKTTDPIASEPHRLPTGAVLDPAGETFDVGQMALGMTPAPESDRVVLLLSGHREQGLQVVDRWTGKILQSLPQAAAFVGLVFSADGRTLYTSGGNQDVVYRYRWNLGQASLQDSLVLARKAPHAPGTRYPAGLGLSPNGRWLYIAENLADSLSVVDVLTGQVTQRVAAGRYPYGVAVTPSGMVYVSAWGGNEVAVFSPSGSGLLAALPAIPVARHPSTLLLSRDASRLFVVSASTDRIVVVDTRAGQVITELVDGVPSSPGEGSTPNALALSPDGHRLFVAEADNNAVVVFDLSARTSGTREASGEDRMAGRIPVGWYPTALVALGDSLVVANGKGRGAGPNRLLGPGPGRDVDDPRGYTLGQLSGTLTVARVDADLTTMSARVARANGWNVPRPRSTLPPFEHVLYIIKENRTYDQVLGDMKAGDGDTSLVYFPQSITPNHHALAARFGLFDRFFVNAEVSPDGHNWSMAAYTTDYIQKTVPSNYSSRGRSYDYEGTNRGVRPPAGEDAAEPANGYLWNLAQRKGISFRNFGEFVVPNDVDPDEATPAGYRGLKPFLELHTDSTFPGFDLKIQDQRRADVWLQALADFVRRGSMPALQIMRLPNDHTMGARAGELSPRAYVADNDLALGRVIEGLSKSPFWRTTAVFVLEDDAQNGPDHVDSHRSVFLVISAYNRAGTVHRFINTTDVLATIEVVLGLGDLSQFDHYGRPLFGLFAEAPDLTPYRPLIPLASLTDRNPAQGPGVQESAGLDFRFEDVADEDLLNRALWLTLKGGAVPYPGSRRISGLELKRGQ